jgi:hypothetical protein
VGAGLAEKTLAVNTIKNIYEPLIEQLANPELLELIGISERSIAVIGDRLLYEMTFEQIADKHGVTKERARQLYVKAVSNVAKRLNWHVRYWKKMPEIEKENEQLKNKLRFFEEQELNEGWVKLPPSIDDPIEDFGFSIRLYNSMKAMKIGTLRDVLAIRKRDFLLFRNVGKISIAEMESVLENMGITNWE